ncbi:MAG TPA: hypothetical protein VGK74_19520 [Symbiobacteriaceae bacterium]|jgi:hypothetical protein
MSQGASDILATRAVFTDPVVELAALCPLCALAALNPTAALAALSPVLRTYNPAINPAAAMLAFSLSPVGMSALVYARVHSRLAGLQLVRAGLRMLFQ